MQSQLPKVFVVASISRYQQETADDQRSRSRPGWIADPTVGHQGGRRPSEQSRGRPRGEWNHRPTGVGRRLGKADCAGPHPRWLSGLPRSLEDARAQAAYGIRSAVNKIVVINREITPGRITVVLVDEVLGF